MRIMRRLIFLQFLIAMPLCSPAFSLLGPLQPWMTPDLGFNNPALGTIDIGGPMEIGQGYRWNIPVITYGYDQSFLDYFGTNGVAAVESAIQVFNNLPPASETNLNSFPLTATRMNYVTDQLGLYDLKTAAMGLVLEQLGLASPTRFIFTLRDYNSGLEPTVLSLSFDPITQEASPYLDGFFYAYNIDYVAMFNLSYCEAVPVYPEQTDEPANVADYTFNFPGPGAYFTSLTRDDLGGLFYLYNATNFAFEDLVPGVQGAGTNAANYVNAAVRPGVGKVTFQRLNFNQQSGEFCPTNLIYDDLYLTNGLLQHQTLEREVIRPDILFTAGDFGFHGYSRTGVSNWVNNGGLSAPGPGVIQPPIAINFGKLGPSLTHESNDSAYSGPSSFSAVPAGWASFDGSTNAPILYPADSTNENSTTVYFYLSEPTPAFSFNPVLKNPSWTLTGQHNEVFLLQTSTNLSDWFTITTITNTGQEFTYFDDIYTNTPQRFFRTAPQ
jgi:hypothetical protein